MASVQFKDYYRTIGVDRGADEREIRSAYRQLARKHHPDVNPGDTSAEERFKEINEAYEVLSDAQKRKMYDRHGEAWERYRDAGYTGDGPGPRPGGATTDDFGEWFARQAGRRTAANGPGSSRTTRQAPPSDRTEESFSWEWREPSSGSGRFSDFFETLFGNVGGSPSGGPFDLTQTGSTRGEDIEVNVDVTLKEAFQGAQRRFEVKRPETCQTCSGTGLARGATCPTCDGAGQVLRAKAIEVKIPKGVATGSRIRVAGQGGISRLGGAPGDAFLRVTIKPDPRFERHGDDLREDVDVGLYTALLGGEVMVPTLDGQVALTIPQASQPGAVFRLRGKGMPKLKSSDQRGDLYAKLKVRLPATLTDAERTLIEQLRDLRPSEV